MNPLQVNHDQPFTHENMAYKVIGVRQLPNTHHYSNDGTVTLTQVGDLVITAQYDHQLTELLFPPQPKEPEYPKYYEYPECKLNGCEGAYIRRISPTKCVLVHKNGKDIILPWTWGSRDSKRKQITKEQADAIVDSFKPKPTTKCVKLHAYVNKKELRNSNFLSLSMWLTDVPQPPDNTTLLEVKGLDLYVDVPVN